MLNQSTRDTITVAEANSASGEHTSWSETISAFSLIATEAEHITLNWDEAPPGFSEFTKFAIGSAKRGKLFVSFGATANPVPLEEFSMKGAYTDSENLNIMMSSLKSASSFHLSEMNPDAFTSAIWHPSIEYLLISDTDIEHLPPKAGNAKSLNKIQVSKTRLETVPPLPASVNSANFESNRIAEIPQWLADSDDEWLLFLDGNPVAERTADAVPERNRLKRKTGGRGTDDTRVMLLTDNRVPAVPPWLPGNVTIGIAEKYLQTYYMKTPEALIAASKETRLSTVLAISDAAVPK